MTWFHAPCWKSTMKKWWIFLFFLSIVQVSPINLNLSKSTTKFLLMVWSRSKLRTNLKFWNWFDWDTKTEKLPQLIITTHLQGATPSYLSTEGINAKESNTNANSALLIWLGLKKFEKVVLKGRHFKRPKKSTCLFRA